MLRRLALVIALVGLLAVGGCAYGTPARLTSEQKSARIQFIEDHGDFSDRDLAQICPGLYPRDFLTNHDDWPAGEKRSGDMSARAIAAAKARDAAAASAAGCDVFPS